MKYLLTPIFRTLFAMCFLGAQVAIFPLYILGSLWHWRMEDIKFYLTSWQFNHENPWLDNNDSYYKTPIDYILERKTFRLN